MAIQLTNITLHPEQPQSRSSSQVTVAGEVTLPGSLREEAHVLHADAMAVVEGADALHDRANAKGRVVFTVLYTQGEPSRMDSIEATADFTHLCDLPGATARSEVYAKAAVEHVQASVSGGRMSLRAVVRIDARAIGCEAVEVVSGLAGEGVQQRQREITLSRTVARGSQDVLLREEFDLPRELGIRETLCARAIPALQDVSGGQGRIGLTGDVTLEAVHVSELPGKPLVVTRHVLPVQQSVGIAGEDGEALSGRMTVKDVAVASQDDGSEGWSLRAEVLLGLDAWADREEAVSILEDAYTTSGENVKLSRSPMTLRTGRGDQQAAESFKASLLLPDGAKPLRNLLACFVRPLVTRWEQQAQRLMVEGLMETTLLYLSDAGNDPVSAAAEVPFRVSFSALAGPEDILTLTAANVEATPITSDRAELRCILHLQVEGFRTQTASLVTEAVPLPAEEAVKDMVLYFVQPGDDVWSVCRRYRITREELQALNPNLAEPLAAGQGVVIWRRNPQE